MTCNPFSADAGTAECAWNWPVIIAAWTFLNVGPAWCCIYKYGSKKPIQGPNDKFKPFNRTDTKQWSYIWAPFTHFFFLPRIILAYGSICGAMVMSWVCSIGYDRRKEPGPWRQALWDCFLTTCCRASTWFYGNYWIEKKKVHYDYSKYLGPDHKESFTGAPTIVLNHQSFIDILLLMAKCHPHPGFIAKWVV